MREYHKINAPFKRNMAGDKKLIIGDWALQEFEFLQNCRWEFTEKVDGTNIRIGFSLISGGSMDGGIYFKGPYVGGRTDGAQIPSHLVTSLKKTFDEFTVNQVEKMMRERDIWSLTLYGEGYGPKIQGGGKYASEASFVIFDVQVGETWLLRDSVDDIGTKLAIDTVPVLGYGTLADGIARVKQGLTSRWGDFEAEGIVARPAVPLFDRQGKRIITKIKGVDFRAVVGQE